MKVKFDDIRTTLINRTNAVLKQVWKLKSALIAEKFGSMAETFEEFEELERKLDCLRNPVITIGCLESDGNPDEPFKALEFDLHAAREEDEE